MSSTHAKKSNLQIATIVEKRVRKDFRANKWIKKNDKLLLINDNSTQFHVTEYLLKSILKTLPITIDKKKIDKDWEKEITKYTKNYNKIIIPLDLDGMLTEFLNKLFNNNPDLKKENKIITILQNVMHSEIIAFAKAKKLPINEKDTSFFAEKLDKLEEKYPGLKFSTKRSIEELQNL